MRFNISVKDIIKFKNHIKKYYGVYIAATANVVGV